MHIYNLLARNLAWYWRTNLAVVIGVATAAGVLGGAVLVGDSVQASLREIALGRLGNVDSAITRPGFLTEDLSAAFPSSSPIIATAASVSREVGRRVNGVEIYGIDDRFWQLQHLAGKPPAGRDAILTPRLARELGVQVSDAVLLRVRKPSAIPSESLHGRKEDIGRTLRCTVKATGGLDFSLQPQQGDLKAVYVPLSRLQRDLEQLGKVNTILLGLGHQSAEQTLKARCTLSDFGLSLRPLSDTTLSLESDSAIIPDAAAEVAQATAGSLGLPVQPVLTYLANSIALDCAGGNCPTVPYSVVTALESDLAPETDDGITLNDWTARNLGARLGDPITLEYYSWKPQGELVTERARFHVERIVPITGTAADRNFAPRYPGITDSGSLRDWDPPFPLDLGRVRPVDEGYWAQYRATPKAFIRLARGRRLWATRFGSSTSVRVGAAAGGYGARLRAALDPAAVGISVIPLRARASEAAQGATNFGEYFLYFSFFLIASALLLTGLFFRLSIEQRTREIGVLRSVGFPLDKIRGLFLMEGAFLALCGGAAGIAAAFAYCGFLLFGLRTWWIGAVGTESISLHASLPGLALGAGGGVIAAMATVWVTVRSLRHVTPRGLVAGRRHPGPGFWRWPAGAGVAIAGVALGYAGFVRAVDETLAFFGAGTCLLLAMLLSISAWLRDGTFAKVVANIGYFGLRNMGHRPGRSILCIALIASATFTIVSLDAFRKDGAVEGAGGYRLSATSVLPLIHDPNSPAGREALNLAGRDLRGVEFVPFRLRPGDDTSCLNLYRPLNPRVLAPPQSFLRSSQFNFQGAIRNAANPWLLLDERLADGAIPAIADANSITYAMHLELGDEFKLNGVRFRLVAALRDSVFQQEVLISEANFLRLFPEVQGFGFFLIETPPSQVDQAARELEDALSDYGFDVQYSAARLAEFHRVENTYLSTFRALGGLGLVLGTLGLAAVLLRNVLERRREFALLRAVGFRAEHLAAIVLVENASILVLGVTAGTASALLAVAPTVSARGGHVPLGSVGTLLGIVLATGLVASLIATRVALRSPLLETLKAE
jgi:putative ABC transport system permease protein